MATDTESFNRDLYNLLKVRGYNPVPLDSKNQRVSASQDSDVIEFQFTKDGEDYGKVWVTVDDAQNIIVYYDEEQQNSPSTRTPGVDYDDTWTGLLKFLKNWAQRRQMSFELANKDRLGDDMRQRDYYKMKEKLGESYHPMGKKASYNDAVPSVKIILQHNRALEEGEQRYRNVARIFLENQDGERFLAPTNKPGLARVYARHIAEGGLPNDEKWNHIKSICEDYSKMAGFVRATKNKQFNESAQELINEGINHYNNLRETLHKLAGHRGYQAYFESWTPTLMEGEGEDISEMFMSQSLDPRIESAMPILSRLKKPVTEMSEVDSLSEWADDIINEKMDSTTASLAVPADEMLDEAPGAETLAHNQNTAEKNLKAFGLAEEDDDKVVKLKPKKQPYVGALAKDFDDEFGHYDELGRIGKLASINRGSEDDMDWDDDSWIPDEEDFEHEEMAKELSRHRGRFAANDINEMDKEHGSKRGFDNARGPDKTAKPMSVKKFAKGALKSLKRGMKGWEKGMHDVDTVKAATKTLSPDSKEELLKAKVGKGSPAELQQKLIKREKNKQVDEARTKKVNVEVTDKGAVYINGTRITGRGTKWGVQNIVFQTKVPLDQVVQTLRDNGFENIRLDPQYSAEMGIQLEEDLGPEQKRVGQLGPTEKVKNNNIGKLVGASESTEIDPELARIIEMARFKR